MINLKKLKKKNMNWYRKAQNITLFHGSNYLGNDLNINNSETGNALFLTDDAFTAAEYGRYVYEVSVNLNTPFTFDAQGDSWFKISMKEIINKAREEGFDSVIFKDIRDGKYTSFSGTVYAILNIGILNILNILDTQKKPEWYLENNELV